TLRYPPFQPLIPLQFEGQERLWQMLREEDVVLHHPFESFEPVVQLVTQAANDPDVLAIKQTLYRTSGDSPIVKALAQAAQSGKQVTVLVELMARFDEERNITWAKQLEKAGVHVIYGLVGLKTHAKMLLIVRREKDGIRRYVHLGTGNYNDRTAKLYTDIGLMTSDEAIGSDASGFFNTITGYSDPPEFRKLTMAPLGLRERFLHLIHRETKRAKSGQYSLIMAKMNALVDQGIIEALYEASQAGVQIKLVIRGICCLRPGLKNISDRISVISIVDRFLEHSRLFYFSNGGDEEFYAASADWMPRNLDRRVELMFPVTSEDGKEKIRKTFEFLFADNVKARVLEPDGTYHFKKRRKNEEMIHAQEAAYIYVSRQKDVPRPLLFKPLSTAPTGTTPLKR
ncbi:MAG TPA: polyphosphate kinase 1, partial [Acidobacteriota bacterium]|nr:polyphosphate kinase 1 [Acidobacteriota bacterium]